MLVFLPVILDAITSAPKRETFSTHLDDTPQKPHNSSNETPKPVIKAHFQDHPPLVDSFQDHLVTPSQDLMQ